MRYAPTIAAYKGIEEVPMALRLVGAAAVITCLASHALAGGIEGGDTAATAPVFTWEEIFLHGAGSILIAGDTSDNTDAADSGVVPGTDCTMSSAPDVWYIVDINDAPEPFLAFRLVINLCEPDAFDSKVYVLDEQDDVIACGDECGGPASPGAVSVEVPRGVYKIVVDGAGTNSGLFNGSIYGRIPRQSCPLDPSCNGVAEGEPCDDVGPDTNAGCNSTPEAFGSITLDGPPVCGTTWQVSGVRDTDWFAFTITETTPVEIDLRSEMPCVAFMAEMSPGGACPVVGLPSGSIAYSDECDTYHEPGVGYILDPGDYIVFVSTGCPVCDPNVPGQFPCSDGPTTTGHAYEVSLRTKPGPPPPCPWDVNQNGDVDFADVLTVLSNWGPCP